MKYTLINCYSDNNRGDLAIIIATIQLLMEHDPNADISGISTYNATDPLYSSEHHILKQYIPIFPSIYGVVNVGTSHATLLKIARFFYDTVRILISLILPKKFVKILYTRNERATIDELCNSDYVISKGGSFICSEKNIRSRIALIRLLYIFLLCIKLGKPPFIICQSIGPYTGFITRLLTNFVLTKCSAVVLREDVCTEQYEYIKLPDQQYISTDIAFFANNIELPAELVIPRNKISIGMTIKNVESSQNEDYIVMLADTIQYCVKKHDADIYIFPHVTIDNDIDNSIEVYKRLPDTIKKRVVIFSDNYHALQLKHIYQKMTFFIGTRLHSTIFSLSENVPSICITYHGTKALGVFKTLGLDEYVIVNYSSSELINTVDNMIENKLKIKNQLKYTLSSKKNELMLIFQKLFNII
jgi:colanic acid/amylovoran biosynthesis protein